MPFLECGHGLTMLDRRIELHALAHKRGTIRLGPAGPEHSCFVINLTLRGAALSVESSIRLPPTFRLEIDGEAGTRHCRVVWVDGKKFGVLFE
jgi:hypothetical protein